jgi:hypothetical protein
MWHLTHIATYCPAPLSTLQALLVDARKVIAGQGVR